MLNKNQFRVLCVLYDGGVIVNSERYPIDKLLDVNRRDVTAGWDRAPVMSLARCGYITRQDREDAWRITRKGSAFVKKFIELANITDQRVLLEAQS